MFIQENFITYKAFFFFAFWYQKNCYLNNLVL